MEFTRSTFLKGEEIFVTGTLERIVSERDVIEKVEEEGYSDDGFEEEYDDDFDDAEETKTPTASALRRNTGSSLSNHGNVTIQSSFRQSRTSHSGHSIGVKTFAAPMALEGGTDSVNALPRYLRGGTKRELQEKGHAHMLGNSKGFYL